MSSRDPWLDNAKMTLVTLAVVGHFWGLLPPSITNDRLYDFLYAWHMPAFVLVSGYLSRGASWRPARLRAVVRTLVVPYLLFEAALAWFSIHFGDASPTDLFLTPIWPLWYLVALVLWRLAAPAVKPLPAPLALLAALAVSLLGGTIDVAYLDLSRVMGLFPFFVLGLVATPELVQQVRTTAVRVVGVATLVLTFVLVRDLDSWAGTSWLYYQGYEAVGSSDGHGILVRAALLALALGCSLGALSLIPSRDGWYAAMGGATMVVFLFHGFVQRGLDYAGFTEWAAGHVALATVLVLVGSVGLSLLLASPWMAKVLGPVADPFSWARTQVDEAVQIAMVAATVPDTEAGTGAGSAAEPDRRTPVSVS